VYSFFYNFRAHYDIHSTTITNPRTLPHHHGEQRRGRIPTHGGWTLLLLCLLLLLLRGGGHAILPDYVHAVRDADVWRANASLQGEQLA